MRSEPELTSTTRRCGGFTLLEVLVALAIMATAIFPLLEITQEAEKNAFDAKFTVIAASSIKILLSDQMALAKPGTKEEGSLADLQFEEDHLVADLDYVDILYEWEVEEIDLSSDVSSVGDQSAEEEEQEEASSEKNQDEEIDERFRSRYAKATIYYYLDTGVEQELTVETYLPPLALTDKQKERLIDPVPN